MTPFLQLSLVLVLLITAAKAGGYLSYRLGQPTVLGELLVGVLLGPSLLNILGMPWFSEVHLGEVIQLLAEIGVLLLMFIAGLDLHVSDLFRSGKVAALAGTLGVVSPLVLGTLVGLLFSMGLLPSLFVGMILSATSVSISA
jgi:Kef-type K+ transport system membrane component KefB